MDYRGSVLVVGSSDFVDRVNKFVHRIRREYTGEGIKMKNYIFFIGGSGARVFKSFLHCCATGINTENAIVYQIDADTENYANKECDDLYKIYQDNQRLMKKFSKINADNCAFKAEITKGLDGVVSPVTSDFRRLEMVTNDQRMLKWFYTEEERKQDLKHGFYARPNIGCLFFQGLKDEDFSECLEKIADDTGKGEDVNVVLVGSLFGGTGASGIPSILNRIVEQIEARERGKIGYCGVFLTPYFQVGKLKGNQSILIDENDFCFNTVEALKYYKSYNSKERKHFDAIYLVGQHNLDRVSPNYVDGGENQKNKGHIVELYAAMAITDYLKHRAMNEERKGIFGHIIEEKNIWNEGREELTPLADMVRTQVILSSLVFPRVEKEKANKSVVSVPQWYKVYDLQENADACLNAKNYTNEIVKWCREMQMKYETRNNELCLVYDTDLRLFGDGICSNNDGNERKAKKDIWEKFNGIVDTVSNIEYVYEKLAVIMSLLGLPQEQFIGKGIAGLVAYLLKITGKKRTDER